MKNIIKKIMHQSVLQEAPPVLVDIGASGGVPSKWKMLAPYSICVAFDADSRDFVIDESSNYGWKKKFTLNRLVGVEASDKADFYLTRSPHCSSSLPPDNTALRHWAFYKYFDINQIVKLPATNLESALSAIGIDYIDWYKTDSQGTDLRIFASLPEKIIKKTLVAEFEPGIIDAYLGEDKLHHLMSYMDKQPFWVSKMDIKGSQRFDQDELTSLNYIQRNHLEAFLKMAPGWCEISYINTLSTRNMSYREYLLGWVFSSLKGEHGFAMHIARHGQNKFQDNIFSELYTISRNSLTSGYLRLVPLAIKKLTRLLKHLRQT